MYAKDEAHREELEKEHFTGRGRIEVSRFKGLGEMPAKQLKDTTMDPTKRNLVRVTIPNIDTGSDAKDVEQTETLVEDLMGRKPERRLAFIQKNAQSVQGLDV
jgi:topoisomerase-4 subunit B